MGTIQLNYRLFVWNLCLKSLHPLKDSFYALMKAKTLVSAQAVKLYIQLLWLTSRFCICFPFVTFTPHSTYIPLCTLNLNSAGRGRLFFMNWVNEIPGFPTFIYFGLGVTFSTTQLTPGSVLMQCSGDLMWCYSQTSPIDNEEVSSLLYPNPIPAFIQHETQISICLLTTGFLNWFYPSGLISYNRRPQLAMFMWPFLYGHLCFQGWYKI